MRAATAVALGLDLDSTRAAWADQPVRRGYEIRPRGPARVVVRDL